jgi:hypothetical protein
MTLARQGSEADSFPSEEDTSADRGVCVKRHLRLIVQLKGAARIECPAAGRTVAEADDCAQVRAWTAAQNHGVRVDVGSQQRRSEHDFTLDDAGSAIALGPKGDVFTRSAR